MNSTEIQDRVDELLGSEEIHIVQLGHPVLRRPAQVYDGQLTDAALQQLLHRMRAVMHAAPGVGLAAPQIGIGLQVAVLEDQFTVPEPVAQARDRAPLPYLEIINPGYDDAGAGMASFYEGCLSFEGYQGVVERPRSILARYLDAGGGTVEREFHGWQGRIFQHETDHLAGTVYIDKALTRSLCSNHEYNLYWAQPTVDRARRELGF